MMPPTSPVMVIPFTNLGFVVSSSVSIAVKSGLYLTILSPPAWLTQAGNLPGSWSAAADLIPPEGLSNP